MNFFKTTVLASAAVAIAGTVAFAAGHANVEAAIKARNGQMQMYAFNLGVLGNMAKGAVDFDAEAAQRAADTLVALSALDTRDMWPVGSSSTDVEGSRALQAAWDDLPAMMKIFGDMQTASAALAENAGSLDGVRANIGALGAACGACHKAYRAPE